MKKKEKSDVLATIKKENVKYVHIQFMDLLGVSKSILIPSTEMENAMNGGVHFDGSSIVGYATIDESDMRSVIITNTCEEYAGSISVTGGSGYQNGEDGVARVITVIPPTGTVLILM